MMAHPMHMHGMWSLLDKRKASGTHQASTVTSLRPTVLYEPKVDARVSWASTAPVYTPSGHVPQSGRVGSDMQLPYKSKSYSDGKPYHVGEVGSGNLYRSAA